MSRQDYKSLTKEFGIKWDYVNGGYYAPYDSDDPDEAPQMEFIGYSASDVELWLVQQELGVCA